MTSQKILAKVLASPANVRFEEMQRLVEAFGFRLLRVNASAPATTSTVGLD
jgi:hypothetical protein